MKIALVSTRISPDPAFSTSCLCLHAYLKAHQPQHQVEIIDAAVENPLTRILEGQFDLVGISAMTADYEASTILAKNIRSSLSIPIILGGIHISTLPESLRDCFDIGVIGEGEETLLELVALYEKTCRPTPDQLLAIKGLVFRDGKEIRQTQPRELLNLDFYPHLDYSAVHPCYFEPKAVSSFARFGVESFLLTSRGCPFKCVFCASSYYWRNKVRYFSVDWVIDEIKALAARGANLIHISDDLFMCNKKRLKIIAERIVAENLQKNIIFDGSGKTGMMDDEMCMSLKSMNVKLLFFGFESGNERTLRYLKCGTTNVAKNKKAVELCRRHGLECWGNVIIGSPGETLEEMEDSIRFVDWAKRHGVSRMNIVTLIPFPGTPVWQTALEKGVVSVNMNFDALKMDSKEVAEGMLIDQAMRPEFIKLRDRAYRHVHSFKWKKFGSLLWRSPWVILKIFLASPGSSIKRMFVPTEP